MSLAWLSHNGNGLVHNGYRLGIGTGYYLKNTFVFQRTNADNGTGVMTLSSTAGVSSYVLSGTATGVSANVSGIDKVLTHVTYTTDDGYRTTVLDHPASSRYSAVTSTASSYFTGNGVWAGSLTGTGYYADKASWRFGYSDTSPANIIVDPAKGALFRVTPVKGSWTASGETGASTNRTDGCGFILGAFNPTIAISWNQPIEQVLLDLTTPWESALLSPTLPESVAYPNFSSYQNVAGGYGRTINAPDKMESTWVSAHVSGSGHRENIMGADYYTEDSANCRWRDKWIRLGIGEHYIMQSLADKRVVGSNDNFEMTATASASSEGTFDNLLWNPVVGVIGGCDMRPCTAGYSDASAIHITPCGESPLSALPWLAPRYTYFWEKSGHYNMHKISTAHYSWVMSGTLLG